MNTFPPPPPPPPNPNPNPNTLHTTLQTLKHLIHISKHTLNSLPTPFTTLQTQTPIPNTPNPKHPSSSTFFYQNCPSVVTFPHTSFNNSVLSHTFALPVVLSLECDNEKDPLSDLASLDYLYILLPSDCFNVRLEVSSWNDYPAFYSFSVVRLVLSCYGRYGRKGGSEGLVEWVLANSRFYGVVINDVFVRDCVMVLFRVCLRAIVREAIAYVSRGENRCRFECRVLREVMMWLGDQFGVLYGEMNGKMFAVNMLKHWLMSGLSGSVFFGGEQRVREAYVGLVKGSEVEAAFVALRERAALEGRIKAMRDSRFVPAYQRVQEHQYITKSAEEERKKRSDYRPIIEHDGVLWHRGDNQDANKNKSREELLAEERDYKRRRMSYRGKKMKRSTTQVMRDIIHEYMEEIKHANLANQPSVDTTNLAREPSSDKHRHDESEYESYRKESVSDISKRSARAEGDDKEKRNNHRDDGQRQEYYNEDRRRSTSRSRDHRQRDDRKRSKKHYTSSPDRSHSRSRDNRKRSKHRDTRSPSIVSNGFEDRYDPSKS